MVRRSTLIVLGVFVFLVGFTILFQRFQANKAENQATATPTTAPVFLYNLGSATIDDIKIADNAGTSIELYLDPASSKWAITGTPADKADSSQIESISTQLETMKIQETLTQTMPLASIGLDSPAYTITVTTSDKTQLVTYVGIQTAIGSGYYVRDSAGQVMIVDKISLNDILNLLKTPPLLPTPTPEVTPTETVSPTESPIQKTPTP